MRKNLKIYFKLISALFFLGIKICNANPVDSITAKTVAKNFYNHYAKKQANYLALAFTEKSLDNIPLYYVFNINNNDGFVIIASDDASLPILGYSTTGHYQTNNLPPEFVYWMNGYKKQLVYIKDNNLQPTQEIKRKWIDYKNNQFGTKKIENTVTLPLTTKWNQVDPYNDFCPSLLGFHAVTGCVATAMAQILKYWNYPGQGQGYHQYDAPFYGTQSVDFGSETYNWFAMPDIVTIANSEVAKLMYDCGVSVNMNYGQSVSNANATLYDEKQSGFPYSAERAYPLYFRFSTSLRTIQRNSDPYTDETAWITKLKSELDDGRPIQYAGGNTCEQTAERHTWVCYGYDANNFFSMNWGWGGSANGWYNLNILNPIGKDWNSCQEALIGIRPNLPDLKVQDAQVSPTTITAGGNATISCKNYNQGVATAVSSNTAVWLSKDQVFNQVYNGTPPDINLYADLYVPLLIAGATSNTLSKQITIPSNTSTGTWYIMFGADALNQVEEGKGETNNQIFIPITVTTSSCTAPLITTQPSNSNVTAPAGTSFTISASGSNNLYTWQYNDGSGWRNVPNSYPYSGMNSTSLNINSTTTSMDGYQYKCFISSSCSVTTTTSGAATLHVSYSSGCNNDYACAPKVLTITSSCFVTSCSTIGATPPSPDVSFKGCDGTPYQSVRYDDDVWFSITPSSSNQVTIKVIPNSNLNNFDPAVGIYTGSCLSLSQVLDGCGDANPEGYAEQLVFTPTAGTTYLIRVFSYDPGSAYSGNFDICVTTAGQPDPPDLIITNPSLSTYSPCAANSVNVSYNLKNVGGTSASSSTVKFYLSSNSTYSSGDVSVGTTLVNGLGSGESDSYNKSITIPAGTSVGTWYLLIKADASDNVNEGTTGEANNVLPNAIQVKDCSGSADLKIQYNSHTPSILSRQTDVDVNYTAQNTGTVSVSLIKIGIYISSDNVFDPYADEFIEDWGAGTLDASESDVGNLSFSIPDCYPCGNAYILLVIDYQNIIPETNNNNNTDYFPIEVTGCTTCSYTIPTTGLIFQSGGGSGNCSITTTPCCPWTATANDSWITIINSSGYGSGVVNYVVAPCSGGNTRTGTIAVAGQTHTITQNCTESCNDSQSFEWAIQAGSTTLSDAGNDVAIDASGNLYMTGDIQGSADFGGGIILTTPSTAPDIFVSKHNASGQIQWAVRYGNINQDKGSAIATDNNGNIYVTGTFINSVTFGSTTLTSNSTDQSASFLLKLNSDGVIQWATKINAADVGSATDLVIDNNNIFVAGGINTAPQLFISKYDISGTQLWYNRYGGTGTYFKNVFGIATDNSGNIFMCGNYMQTITLGSITLNATNASFDIDGFTAKLDANGNVVWAQKLTSPGQGSDELRGIAVDAVGNIYTVGKVDSTAIVGNITIPLSNSSKEIIIKYDQDGNPLWAKASINGYQYNKQSIVIGNDNDMYFCGDFYSSMQIDSFAIIGVGSNDAFMIRMDENGKIKWMKGFGGIGNENARGIAINSTNDVFVAGGFQGTVTFGNTTLTSTGSTDIYLAKFKQCDPPVASITYDGNLVLCPGQTLTLSTTYCPTNNYQWILDNIEIPGANNPSYLATQAGTYNVKVSAFAGCETISASVVIASQGSYTFTGNGNWDVASNWINNAMPPSTLPSCYEIIINPQTGGQCILNVHQTISSGAKLTVLAGKKFRVLGDFLAQ